MSKKKWLDMTKTEQDAYWVEQEKLRAYKAQGIPAKRCSKCGRVKPLTEFYVKHDNANGRRSECKQCGNARTQQRIVELEREVAELRELLKAAE